MPKERYGMYSSQLEDISESLQRMALRPLCAVNKATEIELVGFAAKDCLSHRKDEHIPLFDRNPEQQSVFVYSCNHDPAVVSEFDVFDRLQYRVRTDEVRLWECV